MARAKPEPEPDAEDVFVAAIESMPDAYFECREMGHDWPRRAPFRLVDATVEDRHPIHGLTSWAERRITCRRCKKVRIEAYAISRSRNGHTSLTKINPSKYEDPEGYAIKGIGPTGGFRDLLHGLAFDEQMERERRRRA